MGGERESPSTEDFVASFFTQPTGEEEMTIGGAPADDSLGNTPGTAVQSTLEEETGGESGAANDMADDSQEMVRDEVEPEEAGEGADMIREEEGEEEEGGETGEESTMDLGGVFETVTSAAMSIVPGSGEDGEDEEGEDEEGENEEGEVKEGEDVEEDKRVVTTEYIKHLQRLHGIDDDDITTDMTKITNNSFIADGKYTKEVDAGEVALVIALVFNPLKTGILILNDADKMDGYGKDDAVMNSHTEMRKMWVAFPGIEGVGIHVNTVVIVPDVSVKEGEHVVLASPLSIRIRRGELKNVTGYVSAESVESGSSEEENITVVDDTIED